jgi:hypothetical protein
MNFKTLLTLHPKNLLKLKRRNIDEKLIMLQTKNGLIKIVDLKDTSLENLQIRNIEIQTILKSEVHTILL